MGWTICLNFPISIRIMFWETFLHCYIDKFVTTHIPSTWLTHDLYNLGHASLIVSDLYLNYSYHFISIWLSPDQRNPIKHLENNFIYKQTHSITQTFLLVTQVPKSIILDIRSTSLTIQHSFTNYLLKAFFKIKGFHKLSKILYIESKDLPIICGANNHWEFTSYIVMY